MVSLPFHSKLGTLKGMLDKSLDAPSPLKAILLVTPKEDAFSLTCSNLILASFDMGNVVVGDGQGYIIS